MKLFLQQIFNVDLDPLTLSNVSAPQIIGDPTVGNTVTLLEGEWQFDGSLTQEYQWFLDGIEIPGATSNSLVLQTDQVGLSLTVRETATDDNSSTFLFSNPIVVQQVPTAPVFQIQPSLAPATGEIGTVFSLELGTVISDNGVVLSIESLLLDDTDVSENLTDLTWDSSSYSSGQLRLTVKARDEVSGLETLSDIVLAELTQPVVETAFTQQPTITPTQAQLGSVFTLELGTAVSQNSVTLSVESLSLDGVDVSSSLNGQLWDSQNYSTGVLALQMRAVDDVTGSTVLSDTVTSTVLAASTGDISITGSPIGSVLVELEALSGTITISGSPVAAHNGTFAFDLAALDTGPINIVPPSWRNNTAPGQSPQTGHIVEKVDGLWIYRPQDGLPILSNQWRWTGADIDGEISSQISLLSEYIDLGGLELRETATNTKGQQSVSMVVIDEAVFANSKVNFVDGVIDTGVQPINTHKAFLLLASGTRNVVDGKRQALLASGSSFKIFMSSDEHIWKDLNYVNESEVLWGTTEQIGAADDFNILVSVEIGRARQVAAQKNGGAWATYSEPDGSQSTGIEMDFGSNLSFGLPGSDSLNSGITRIAVWFGDTSPDISDPSVRGRFFNEDGSVKHPSIGNYYFGEPLIDVYGEAQNYSNLVNHGTGANLNSIVGTFTDA